MKIRTGFVSNSSSSSFVCLKCEESHEGYDGDYGDIKNLACEYGHDFCSECISLPEDERDDYSQEFSSTFCPVCTFKLLTDFDARRWLLRKYKTRKEEVLEEIKGQFSTYQDFAKYMKEKR
jgi:hypothetical protein